MIDVKQNRRVKEGVVVSTKMEKTAVVLVERTCSHPHFNKVITRSKKYYAHCDGLNVQEGQRVRMVETRPLSKLKRWRVVEVIA